MTDEVMMEVHTVKDEIGAKFGDDLNELFDEIKRGEATLLAAGVKVLAPPANPRDLPKSALQRTRFARR